VLIGVLGEQFDGIGVTDDYSAYQSQFSKHQLCWAHFLRKAIAKKLQSRIRMICRRYGEEPDDAAPADDAKFVRLQNELVDHIKKLFVFVLHPEVEATNNRSERQARSEAMARKAARTSKTDSGAKRRGVIMSVLASLSKRLEHFTLGSVLSEINHWFEAGHSVFQKELAKLHHATGPPSTAET